MSFVNTDYAVASFFRHIDDTVTRVVSYDIACQWSKKFLERLAELPSHLESNPEALDIKYVVPKLHIQSHILSCQEEFSLNFLAGSGMTDGEGVERPWASVGPIATSTREMGPGSRHDTLDDHWGYWNWRKLVGLGECGPISIKLFAKDSSVYLLLRRLKNALKEQERHEEAFQIFCKQQAKNVQEWTKLVEEYEADPDNAENPYKKVKSSKSPLPQAPISMLKFYRCHDVRHPAGTG